jgi:hypothetical protein
MTTPSEDRTLDDLADGRNGRIVGENDDNVLESFGKAVLAPLEGADEVTAPADDRHGRAQVEGARTLPPGPSGTGAPSAPRPAGPPR